MLRPVAVIAAAIALSRPELPAEQRERWATVLQAEARTLDFDPLSVVAIVHHESGWRPDAVSANGEDLGLGQVRARYLPGCRGDEDPVHHPSEACQAEKARLLDPEENLRVVAQKIGEMRKLCRKKTGSAAFPRWLAAYQGRNYPARRQWCVPGEGTWKVVRYHARLVAEARKRERRPAR